MTSERASARLAAVVCFANVAILGYALHRGFFAISEPDPRVVGPTIHIAYFWRSGTAIWWGAMAGLAGWRHPGLATFAIRALPVSVGVAMLIAVLVP